MKLRNSGRWMFACHHEAGHILTYWYFGYPVDWAVVLTVAQIRAGIEIKNANGDLLKAEGLVQANDVCRLPFGPVKTPDQPEIYKFFHLDREKLRDIELINLTAGMKAESIHRRISMNFCALGGGSSDIQRANEIICGWYPDKADHYGVERLAERRAEALLRSSSGAAAIAGLSRALYLKGRIGGREIRSICKRAFQGRQVRDVDWIDHWPPTMQQLRNGYLPPSAQS